MTEEPAFPPPTHTYPEASRATIAVVLGLIGFLGGIVGFLLLPYAELLGFFSPFAWFVGRREMKRIDAGLRDPIYRTNAKTGMIFFGIVGTVVIVLLTALYYGLATWINSA